MTTIACIGWGSLIWDPRQLPIQRHWFEDGPLLPIEFVRQARDGRVTLAISQAVRPVRTLWAIMDLDDPGEARAALRDREGCTDERIGFWPGGAAPDEHPHIARWAAARDIDAVVWTGLKPVFGGVDRTPSEDEVVDYLRGLRGTVRELAERYIRRAPRQTDTAYRRRIEAEFGWTPLDGWPPAQRPPYAG